MCIRDRSTSAALGLHAPNAGADVKLSTGGVISYVQLTVLDVVDVLPHASVAVNVLVCEREQELLCTALSLKVTVGVPHPSVAVAVPSDPSTSAALGLHAPNAGADVKLSTGGVISYVQFTVLDVVDVLPHASVAVNVLVCEREQELLCTALSLKVTVGVPHPSVAVAVPSDPSTSAALGLHAPNAGADVKLSTGGVISYVQFTVLATVDVLPQPSLAVNVLVCEREQELLCTALSLKVTVGVPHPSVAVAVPSDPSTSAALGLHAPNAGADVKLSTGGVISYVQFTVLA